MLAVGWEMEDKMADWMELSSDWTERYHLGFPAAPQIDQAWIDQLEAEWEAARVDPLDGLSLFMLFYQPEPAVPEEEEYVWDPQPTDAQLAWDQNFHLEPAEAKDDVDEAYLAFYVDGEVIPNEHRQLGYFRPLVDKLSEVVRKFHHESDPTDNIVPIKEPRPRVTLEDDCLVMAIDEVPANLWDVDDIVDLNSKPLPEDLWDVDKVGNPDSYFVRKGGGHAYMGQIEPFWDPETRAWLPGFEIFAGDTWADTKEEIARDELAEAAFKKQLAKIKEKMDWLKTFDQGSLEMLFSQVGLVGEEEEAEVLMLGPDSSDTLQDPTALIVEAKGSINNCIFTPRLTCIDDESESDTGSVESKSSSESELVPLGPPRDSFYFEFESTVLGNPAGFYEMHDPASDYFADFYINCVDPDDEGTDFDGNIPAELRSLIEREDERHAQPLKEEVISVNLKDDSDPRMMQIGSTLSPEDRVALVDLLKEYLRSSHGRIRTCPVLILKLCGSVQSTLFWSSRNSAG
ncbi:hypothetical protein RHMOL_Rhmol06G0007000 [Rhododendron molle]|uniref:Uncharacterized protein n=1 Tax=Rhododendron molle TaxID=49168 RepID=A0ACC0N8Q0_RHOML|nr:hypothetical protein RHMOL_Rhmol06G0007000 [Rhododendron molle]